MVVLSMSKEDLIKQLEAMFAKRASRSPEEQELRDWIKRNKDTLMDRDAVEVAHLAILVGFERKLVYSIVVNFSDALNDSDPDNRTSLQVSLTCAAIDQFHALRDAMGRNRDLELMRLWEDLAYNQTGEKMEGK